MRTYATCRALFCLVFLVLVYGIGFWGVAPVFANHANQFLALTHVKTALVLGIFGLGMVLGLLCLMTLSQKLNRKCVLTVALGIFGASSYAMTRVSDGNVILWLRLLQGFGVIGPLAIAMLGDVVEPRYRYKAMNMVRCGVPLSFVLSMILGPVVAFNEGINGVLVLNLILAVVGVVMVWLLIPQRLYPSIHQGTEFHTASLKTALTFKSIWQAAGVKGLAYAIMMGFFVALPSTIHRLSQAQGEAIVAAFGIIACLAFLGMIFLLRICYRHRRFRACGVQVAVLACMGSVLCWFGDKHLSFLLVGALCLLTSFLMTEKYATDYAKRVGRFDQQGASFSVVWLAGGCGAVLGAFAAGYGLSLGHEQGVYEFIGVLALLWLLLAVSMNEPSPLATRVLTVTEASHALDLEAELLLIPGVLDASIDQQDSAAYLLVNRNLMNEEDLNKWQKAH